MTQKLSLFDALKKETPLQLVGVINALTAQLAEKAGFNAIYLSGAGVANTRGMPDLGLTSLNDVLYDVEHITQMVSLPLLVDVDTGWGSPLNVERTFKLISRAGAMGAHIEDQTDFKRCGHREGKKIVTVETMCDRIKAAVMGRTHDRFMVMARTDALQNESEAGTLARVIAYEAAGADAIFLEAVTKIDQYQRFRAALSIPILANITEFGKTPLYTVPELKAHQVDMILYPLSAFRAMNKAAEHVYNTLRQTGTQKALLREMQTRQELYQLIQYEKYESQLNHYFAHKEHDNDE